VKSIIAQRTVDFLRLSICALALWVVCSNVAIDDQVHLLDGRTLTGTVTTSAESVAVALGGGSVHTTPLAEVAVDTDGAPSISYGLRTAWRASGKLYLLLAIVFFTIVAFLQAQRIQMVLGIEKIRLRYWDAVRLSFAGNFLNFAAPLGSTAGDVFKAYYLAKRTSRKTEAMTIVFLDRAIGLSTLLLTVSLITITAPSSGRLGPFRAYMLVLLGIGILGACAYLSPRIRRIGLLKKLATRLPMYDQLARIDATARNLATKKGILSAAVLNTIVLQIFAALAFFVVAIAVGMRAGSADAMEYYAYFSTGELIKALPGPPQGLGTMELAYRYLFAPFGSASQILCAAFVIRAVTLACSLPGILVAFSGTRQRSRQPEFQTGMEPVPVRVV
jgi:uncharacterized protein (TIRG00374 family)